MNSPASWSTNVAIDEICLILTWICTTVQLQTHLNDVSEHLRIKFCPHYVCLPARFFLAAIYWVLAVGVLAGLDTGLF